jgi:hypothetical protein
MNTLPRKTALITSSCFALIALVAASAEAAPPKALLFPPSHYDYLPSFGFSSFNIQGIGERVTSVRRFGLASRLGLESGDTILRLNGHRLNYHGAWNDALHQAVDNGGWVQLTIRDVRSGRIVNRQTFVGDNHVGPITPKFHGSEHVSHGDHHHPHHVGYPSGPITPKSKPNNKGNNNDFNLKIKKIAQLFD